METRSQHERLLSAATAATKTATALLLMTLLTTPARAAEVPTRMPEAAVPGSAALPPGGAPAPATQEEELDEVLVQGSKLWQLREAIVDAQERFYSLYNELNQDRDYDVSCRMEAPIGTRLKKRTCHIAFMEAAQTEYAQAYVTGRYVRDPNQVWIERSADYQENARALLKRHPELVKLAQTLERAQTKYDRERKKRFKGRWIVFE